MPLDVAGPFWGESDALNQFCEAKYAVTPYVAEFWNTVSNIPFFIGPGLFCLYRDWGKTDLRVKAIWFFMILVGVGSTMFHCTMRFKWQMLDEVPMVLLVAAGLISKDDTHWASSGWRKLVLHGLFAACSATGLWLYISTGDYELFLQTFVVVILLDLALDFPCLWRPDRHGSHVTKALLLAYVFSLGLGKFFWEVERRWCTPGAGGPLAWLHVLWHALSGLACYFGLLADAHNRYSALGVGGAADDPESRWPLLWIFGSWLRSADGSASKRD